MEAASGGANERVGGGQGPRGGPCGCRGGGARGGQGGQGHCLVHIAHGEGR